MPIGCVRCYSTGNNAPFGAVAAINPLLIIVLVPTFAAYVAEIPVQRMLLLGTTVASVSYFCVAALPTLLGVCLYSAVQTIGEAIYAPRMIEYSVTVAPGNQSQH